VIIVISFTVYLNMVFSCSHYRLQRTKKSSTPIGLVKIKSCEWKVQVH